MEAKGQQHNIQQLKVDFSLTGESDYQQVQDRISQLCQGKLTAEMEALFSKLADPDSLVRIDRLEIDVGTVQEEELETAVLKGVLSFLETELAKVFSGRVTEIRYTTESLKKGESTDLVSLLAYYLLMGTWPVWKAVEVTGTPEAILLGVLRNQPADLRALLFRLGRQDRVKRKLAYQFSFPTYVSLVRLMAPGRADGLLVFLEAFRTLHNRQTTSAIPMVDLDGKVREFVLENILGDTQSVFVGKVFLGQFFNLLAHAYRVDRVVLIYRYRERVLQPELAALIDRKFVTALSDLWAEQEEALDEGAVEFPGAQGKGKEADDQTDELIQFLETGESKEIDFQGEETKPAKKKAGEVLESEHEEVKSEEGKSETPEEAQEESAAQKEREVDPSSQIEKGEESQAEVVADADPASRVDPEVALESAQENQSEANLKGKISEEKIGTRENEKAEVAAEEPLESEEAQPEIEVGTKKISTPESEGRVGDEEGEELVKINEEGRREETGLETEQEGRETEHVEPDPEAKGESTNELGESAESLEVKAKEKAALQNAELEKKQEGKGEGKEASQGKSDALKGEGEDSAMVKEEDTSANPEAKTSQEELATEPAEFAETKQPDQDKTAEEVKAKEQGSMEVEETSEPELYAPSKGEAGMPKEVNSEEEAVPGSDASIKERAALAPDKIDQKETQDGSEVSPALDTKDEQPVAAQPEIVPEETSSAHDDAASDSPKQEEEPSKEREEKDQKEKSDHPAELTVTDSPPFPTETPTPLRPQNPQIRDLEERLQNAPHTLMPDLVRLGMRAAVRRKWQADLPESLIWLILEKRLPWDHEQLKQQVTTVEKLLESSALIPWSPAEIHEQVLAGVLDYTFAESGQPFDPGTFIRLLAWKISRKVAQPEEKVLNLLQSTAEEIALAQQEAEEATPDFPAKAGLVLYLTAGELPPGETLANLRRSFLKTLAREPKIVTQLLVQLEDPATIVRKLNLFLPSDALISLVNAFQPIDRRILEEFDRETRILGEQLGKRLERSRPFYRYFWETVLQVLITRKIPGSDARKLVQMGLQGAAERIGMAYGDWLGYALFFAGQLDRPETKLPLLKPVLREEFAQTHPVPQATLEQQSSGPEEPTLDSLVEYLVTGKSAAVPSGSIQAYFGTLMEKWVHTENDLIPRLLPILKEPSAKQRRLFDLLPEAVAPLFFTELSGMPGGFGKDVVQVLDWFAIALKPMPLWRLVLEQTLEVQPFHPKGFLRLVLRHSTAVVGIEYVELLQRVRTLARAMGGYFHYSGTLPLLIEAIESDEIEFGFVSRSVELPPISRKRPEGPVSSPKQSAAEPEKRTYPKIWDKAPDKFSGQYRVHNAGIVLISSFIGRYFEVLGVVDDDGFTDDEAQYRSVLLLYYLATGKTTAKQEDLLLQRILCGLSPGATLKTLTLEPTEREVELTASLLKTVISYWTTLGETTVGTFRESFLTRSGELAKQQKGWRLRMDKEAFDLLMRTLPWSFSPVNFSWMDTVIEVEWEEGM